MRTDYLRRITTPVCQHEPGSVYDHIMTAIQRARETNRYDVMEKIFKEAYDLYNEYEAKMNIHLLGKSVIDEIHHNPNYTPLHGMVMACLYAAFGKHDDTLELLVRKLRIKPEFTHFKPIISYYRSKHIMVDYVVKDRIEHIRSLEQKEKELNGRLIEYEHQIKQLKEENEALKESLPTKQENMFTLEEILDYMRSKKKIEFCEQIAIMLNHFSRRLTEDGWNQVQAVENELSNGSLTNVVNHNHIEGSYVIQGVIKDSKFSK